MTLGDGGKGHTVTAGTVYPRKKRKQNKNQEPSANQQTKTTGTIILKKCY